ncbi:hypothetical protein HZH68_003752 [Vespula germanica]|uniref:Uncharacterized protein n=1 Tax=Vespula germanica TaxID=30212 RepID=A0A834NPQ6_VESGE|nr:hypothetical protein HZH68_003752 [Vespula germanica]
MKYRERQRYREGRKEKQRQRQEEDLWIFSREEKEESPVDAAPSTVDTYVPDVPTRGTTTKNTSTTTTSAAVTTTATTTNHQPSLPPLLPQLLPPLPPSCRREQERHHQLVSIPFQRQSRSCAVEKRKGRWMDGLDGWMDRWMD